MTELTSKQLAFVKAARAFAKVGPEDSLILERPTILIIAERAGLKEPQWLTNQATYRVSRGTFQIPTLSGKASKALERTTPVKAPKATPPAPVAPEPSNAQQQGVPALDPSMAFHTGKLVPERMPTYVPFGVHKDLSAIVKSGRFHPVYVTGLSGNGKTTTFEQVCAQHGKEFFRVNITAETNEDDLLGGFRLINGNMTWVDGPVIVAMKRGAFLLLDEVDLGTQKIMCLQPVLEGKPVFLKKICQWVHPAKGFQVGLTGNTKGRGDETGRFIGTNPMNEAFLDRVAETMEQDYPKADVEEGILLKVMESMGVTDTGFAKALVRWAEQNRKAYAEGAIEDVVTTRRLIYAISSFAVYGDRVRAVQGVLTRFDATTRQSLLDLYKKLDAASDGGVNTENLGAAPTAVNTAPNANGNSVPF